MNRAQIPIAAAGRSYRYGNCVKDPRFLIISEPRTGSNNLSYCLGAHPELEVGNELLHPRNGVSASAYGIVVEAAGNTGSGSSHWVTYIDAERRAGVIDSLFERYNGFKIHIRHIPVDLIIEIIGAYQCTVLLTRRLSLFDQALSNFVATARNRWHADERKDRLIDAAPFEIPVRKFLNWMEFMQEERTLLWSRLAESNIPAIPVIYEDFYRGSIEERIARVDGLYSGLGLAGIASLDSGDRAAVLKKMHHYLDDAKQKLTTSDDRALVINFDELREASLKWQAPQG